jgi:hypothetical protein
MPILTTQAAQILNKEFGGTNYSPNGSWYVGLRSGGSELSGGSYARVPITNDTTSFPNVAANVMVNGVAITFPQASADWATADEVALFSASSGGTPKYTGVLDTPVTVQSGQTREFAPGDLRIKMI